MLRLKTWLACASLSAVACAQASLADSFKVLDAFETNPKTGVLDLDLTIEPLDTTFNLEDPTGSHFSYTVRSNVYDACLRRGFGKGDASEREHCSKNYFGGPRLVLKQGDTLRMRLHNQSEAFREYGSQEPEDSAILPKAGEGHVVDGCANVHTHGLIVRANAPDDKLPSEPNNSFGDNVFVIASPQQSPPGAVGCPGEASGGMHAQHMKMTNAGSDISYEIKIPGKADQSGLGAGTHPSGLFWFHPHVHSLAKEEVSGGLAGMINVGSIKDYGCLAPAADGTCKDSKKETFPALRHLLLKDVQLGDLDEAAHRASVVYDQDAGFCEDHTADGFKGYCDHFNKDKALTGRWLFPVNGAVHPTWNVPSGRAEVWRIQNASANVTYDLRLGGGGWDADSGDPLTDKGGMPFQLLSLDGVGLGLNGNGTGATGYQRPSAFQRRLILMPGSRAEILVSMRDPQHCDVSQGKANWANCPAYAPASDTNITIVNAAYGTGGDTWPKIELAEITYKGKAKKERLVSGIALKNENDAGNKLARMRASSYDAVKNPAIDALCKTGSAKRLSGTEKRRIYFAIVTDEDKPNKATDPNWRAETFVLGASIIGSDGKDYDEEGNVLPDGPLLYPADMSSLKSDLCVPFGAEETWELVNLSEEVHNFHIHQTKFKVARTDALGQNLIVTQDPIDDVNIPDVLITKAGEESVTHDTILVPRGKTEEASPCGTDLVTADKPEGHFVKPDPAVQAYHVRSGSTCRGNYAEGDKAGAMGIRIPFKRAESIGRYVYHCHILEHEDLGMMSSIRVLSDQQMAGVNAQ